MFLFRKLKNQSVSPFYVFLACWIAEVFFQVQFAHSKLVSYILPLYPALAIITGDYFRTLYVTSLNKARMLALATLGIFLLLPPAMIVAAFKFPAYVPYPGQVCAVMAVFCSIIFIELLLVRRKVSLFPYALAINMVFLLFTLLAFDPWADDFVSVKNASQYLTQQYTGKSTVLCSKMAVRGVRYYTGKEVGVLKIGGGAFFSPHPIVFIDTTEKLLSYLSGRMPVYAVLEHKDVERVQEALKGYFNCNELKQFGTQAVVRIDSM